MRSPTSKTSHPASTDSKQVDVHHKSRFAHASSTQFPTRIDPFVVGGLAIAVAIWYVLSLLIGRYMPFPHVVLMNAVSNLFQSTYLNGLGLPDGGYFPHLLYTTFNVVSGVIAGSLIGMFSGLCSTRWRIAEQITNPISLIFGTVPMVAIAPFFLILFGIVGWAQMVLVAFYSVITVHIYTLRALRNVNPRYAEYAYTLGASADRVFMRVCFPAAIPEIFGGIRTAFGAAWGLAAIAELLGTKWGVGRLIITLWTVYDATSMIAIVLMLGLIAMALDAVLVLMKKQMTRWADIGGRT